MVFIPLFCSFVKSCADGLEPRDRRSETLWKLSSPGMLMGGSRAEAVFNGSNNDDSIATKTKRCLITWVLNSRKGKSQPDDNTAGVAVQIICVLCRINWLKAFDHEVLTPA